MHKDDYFLECENGAGVFEVQSRLRQIIDDKPFHLGISILQHSKESFDEIFIQYKIIALLFSFK